MDGTSIIRAAHESARIISSLYRIDTPRELTPEEKVLSTVPKHLAVGHLLFMPTRIEREFALRESLGKANRWLGFMQGWMWCDGIASIHASALTNMPR